MKKHKVVYGDNYIEIWPSYTASVVLSCIYGVLWLLLFTMVYLPALVDRDSVTLETWYEILIFQILFTVCAALIIILAIYKASNKVIISHTGLMFSNKKSKKVKFVGWEDIDKIYYYKNSLIGTESYRFIYKNSKCDGCMYKGSCDYMLPIDFLDRNKIKTFIPEELMVKDSTYKL